MDGSYSTHVGGRNAERILMGKSEGDRPFWKYTHGWDDNATSNRKEIGWEGQDLD